MGPSAAPNPGLCSAFLGLTLLTPFGQTPGFFIPSSRLSTTRVATPQQLFFSGKVKGESAMRSERDVGSKVKYEVTVSILCGPSSVPSLLGTEAGLWKPVPHMVVLGFQCFCTGWAVLRTCWCRGLRESSCRAERLWEAPLLGL